MSSNSILLNGTRNFTVPLDGVLTSQPTVPTSEGVGANSVAQERVAV